MDDQNAPFDSPCVRLSKVSRLRLWLMRWLLRPLLAVMLAGGTGRVVLAQLAVAQRRPKPQQAVPLNYGYHGQAGRVVAGHSLGNPFRPNGRPVLLWLHGGAFVLPAMPAGHLAFAQRVCQSLSASAFLPDYRLAPAHPYPAALDDCERAFRALLEAGVPARHIVIGGESAGGNLLMALLYRIRRHNLPMPVCAVGVSPALDLARLHGSASRTANMNADAMLPLRALAPAVAWYLAGADSTDEEVSPLYGDCQGLPPLQLIASEREVLRDDSISFAERARAAGVSVELSVWPCLPHAFPLLEDWFPEAAQARERIEAFIRNQLSSAGSSQGEN